MLYIDIIGACSSACCQSCTLNLSLHQAVVPFAQDLDDVTLHTSAVEVGSAREVSVSFRARSLRMVLRGQPVVDGKLTEAVHPEECTWQFGASLVTESTSMAGPDVACVVGCLQEAGGKPAGS